jgi:hypothetical protein
MITKCFFLFSSCASKKFPSNDKIRRHTIKLLDKSCSAVNDKKTIERSGTMEVLVSLLSSDDDINEVEKNKVRDLIVNVVSVR